MKVILSPSEQAVFEEKYAANMAVGEGHPENDSRLSRLMSVALALYMTCKETGGSMEVSAQTN